MIQESKEDVESGASSVAAQEDSFDATLVSTTERRLMTKIDLHLLPVLCVLYLLAFLDRVNISNAVIFGLRKDLGIESGNRYNTALTIFFVPYILFEIPSNILLKKLKPHVWLSGCMFGFGLVTLCQGLVQNYAGLLVTRFLLGLLETGMFPGYKIFVGGLMYFGLVVPAYGYAYFAPTIIRTFGHGPIQTQLYSIPPWAAAFGVSLTVAYLSDRLRNRFAFTLIPICIAIAGFAILLNVHGEANRALQYGALFLITSGAYSAMPIIICWYSMNLGGHKRRSVGIAWQIGFGNIGGIIATYSFLEKDRPQFRPGHVISISFICLSAAMCVVYFFLLLHRNRTRDKLAAVDSSGALKQAAIDPLQGDLSPSFRYQL
ncbi:MFS transporter [Histoplasma capsulatum H143]|uniref:MFS transporter n=1 Tax=Ajellomyces capsulatus (strain H143) TaxID=544712 RepID=C6HPQ4_AJECH|nr:MFS transporter [Histoplasma capsulatum H143]